VGVLAVQVFRTLVPVAIVLYESALVEVVHVEVGWSAEVLLAVGVVALRPLVLLVDEWAETRFVGINHELVQIHGLLVVVQVLREPFVGHQISHCGALLGTERQGVDLLLFFIQGLDAFDQEVGRERMQLVGSRMFAVDNDQGAVEVSGAIDFELVGEGIARKAVSIALEEKNVEAHFFSHGAVLAVWLDRDFLSEDAEQGLFVRLDIFPENWFPETWLGLEDIFETGVLVLGHRSGAEVGGGAERH
jgi:hypothetical protein